MTERLEYLRSQIRAECISYGEIAELQGLASEIEPGDVELLQWAGVPEFPELFASETEKAGFVARVENQTGHYIVEVEEVTILPPITDTTCRCGNHIEAFICVQWCDECFDAFDAKQAEGHPDPFEGPRERWRAAGWRPS